MADSSAHKLYKIVTSAGFLLTLHQTLKDNVNLEIEKNHLKNLVEHTLMKTEVDTSLTPFLNILAAIITADTGLSVQLDDLEGPILNYFLNNPNY